MATPPVEIPHDDIGSDQATATIETSLEVGASRDSYGKRTSLEPDLTEKNDINEMAPSSAIFLSDISMNDNNKPTNEAIIADETILANSIHSHSAPASKRVKYSSPKEGLTASDYAQLKPVVQPDTTFSRPTVHSLSRKRTIADLVPPPSQCSPIDMDEPDATIVYGEPVDSSSSALSIEISEEGKPFTPALTTRYPGSSQVALTSPSSPKGIDDHSDAKVTGKDNKQRSLSTTASSLFMPSHHTPRPRRNSCVTKKGFQRPVRIQLLDEAESDKIREEGGYVLTSQTSSPSLSEQGLLWEDNQTQDLDAGADNVRDATLHRNTHDEQSIALPIEDPMVHDWDMEELDDEESEASITLSGEDSSNSFENNSRREAECTSKDMPNRLARIRRASISDAVTMEDQDEVENEQEDDDKWDPMMDPEREISSMSEDQEVELHNVHMRLENQRDFQDASSLDLGEVDGQATSEDGRYGGAIVDDDEGEDFWENR
ncbi:hypothetical protein BGZ46_002121 [Entomortierella lignicola]|nr:hypothetical protein BGZ46_002121 [Entomortierella lignicola]